MTERLDPAQILDRLGISLEELGTNPHPAFKRLRETAPFFQMPLGGIFVLRYKDVDALFTDPRTRQVETEAMELRGVMDGPLYDIFKHGMLFANGEVHARRRAPFSKTFAFRLIQALRPRITALVNTLIDEHAETREMDFLEDFAKALPARMICDILGAPKEDVPRFIQWVEWAARGIAIFDDKDLPQINDGVDRLFAFVRGLLDERRANPRDDFLTDYVRAVDAAGNLSPEETYVNVAGVILAGSDTTRTGLTVMLSQLLQRRDQWDALRAEPALIPGAIKEALRYDPPVGSLPRISLEPIEVSDGYVIEANRVVFLSLISALRDPAVYPDPDRFDITRDHHPRWHLAFGGGAHRCLGEALALAEMEEALYALSQRLPHLDLAGPLPKIAGHAGIRRIEAMPVAWKAAPAHRAPEGCFGDLMAT